MKKITLKRQGFIIKGTSDLFLWGGGRSSIKMTEFKVKHLRELKDKINDAGFGVEKINGAICEIYDDFGKFANYRRQIIFGNVNNDTFENHYQYN